MNKRAVAFLSTIIIVFLAGTAPSAAAADFVVTTTADNGPGSLRDAINQANATSADDRITFSVGRGPVTIAPLTELPELANLDGDLMIDGSSQPGCIGPCVELTGGSAGPNASGLTIEGGSVVRGLVINRFADAGIVINECCGESSGRIVGNRIGTTVDGMSAAGNGVGVRAQLASSGNTIGGMGAADTNVIAGNTGDGVVVDMVDSMLAVGPPAGNLIVGNLIGVAADGQSVLGNRGDGVRLGSAEADFASADNQVRENVIRFNGGAGVRIPVRRGDLILDNAIDDNQGLGIDVGTAGVSPNTSGDRGPTPNYPVLTGAGTTGGVTMITGALDGKPGRAYTLDFAASPVGDPSGHGEGARPLGSTTVTMDSSGRAAFRFTATSAVAVGHVVAATATRPTFRSSTPEADGEGGSSEFSRSIVVTDQPPPDAVIPEVPLAVLLPLIALAGMGLAVRAADRHAA